MEQLNFLLGPGSSGGPVFTPDEVLIGVGVGSFNRLLKKSSLDAV
jgi:hypothetical protein